jgi:hypothetical protein
VLKREYISAGAAIAAAFTMIAGDGCMKNSSTGPAPGGGPGGVGGPVSITGHVIGQNGQPVDGVPVFVTGTPSTNSDGSGSFTIANVTTPYDLSIVDATSKSALVYKGLTRTDPTILFVGATPGAPHNGSASGAISGGTFTPNEGASDQTTVVFSSPEATGSTATAAGGAFGPITLAWFGPTVTTGTLYALQVTLDGGGIPIASGYRGYGVRSGIAVNDGSTLNNQFDTLKALSTNQFTGAVSVPAGYTLAAKVLFARLTQTAIISLLADVSPNPALSYYTPGIPGATLLLGTEIIKAGGGKEIQWENGMGTGATNVSVAMVGPPELSLPVAAATGVDTTVTFSWMPMTGGVHLVLFGGGVGTPTYYVLTAGTTATIPNMKPFGLGLPSSAPYTWSVIGLGPFASVDAACGSASFIAWLRTPPVLASGEVLVGQSADRPFTTAP